MYKPAIEAEENHGFIPGTIEEKILELQENKRNLVKTVLDGNESRSQLNAEDIREILGIQ